MMRNLRNAGRLVAIALTLAREDALFIFDDLRILPGMSLLRIVSRKSKKRKGERLATALEKLGPPFIKLGQLLSTRSDLIGDELAEDLSRLRDSLPPFSTAVARATVEHELHKPIAWLFDQFEPTPVAAASIAQVHKAVTKDGRTVAVKILRPGIEDDFARDLDLFYWLAEIMVARASNTRRLKPLQVVDTLKESVFFELDLRFEGAAANELAENVSRHGTGFRVPKIDWGLTGRRVLTMEWIEGIPLHDVDAIRKSGHSPDAILTKAANSLFAQVFNDGFFHADLHPGNLFVDAKGDLVAVDFGIMGRLDWESRMFMAEILRGFLNEDYRRVAEVHFAAGYVPAGKSLEAFTQACMAVARPIVGKPLNEISVADLLGQMFKIAAEFEMETQPQLLLLQKTMMVTEGVGRMLNPNLNMWQLAQPMMETWAAEQFGPGGKLKHVARQGAETIRKAPLMLRQAEQAMKNLSDPDGVRLHPHTVKVVLSNRTMRHRQWLTFAWAALATMLLCVFLLAQ
jgi:ubiquinone biosynthesis protein